MSNFKVAKWVPSYLRWYRFAFGPRLTADQMRQRGTGHQGAALQPEQPEQSEGQES
jgi:hypothetical protein